MKRGYFTAMWAAGRSVLEGMAVTLAELMKQNVTVQYPDRTARPVAEMLPERYRGFLEVDLDICTGCKACERACPIDVIKIDLVKRADGLRGMTRFDIDIGKCMYCNLCVEDCPVDALPAEGDVEPTRCIRMTKEFEAATTNFNTLTFRFIRPGDFVPPFKPTKGKTETTVRRGDIAREVRRRAQAWNPVATEWAFREGGIARSGAPDEVVREPILNARVAALEPLVRAATGEGALAELLCKEAFPPLDCEACGHATCRAYADALASGADTDATRCAPGGPRATRDALVILRLGKGASAADAATAARAAVLRTGER